MDPSSPHTAGWRNRAVGFAAATLILAGTAGIVMAASPALTSPAGPAALPTAATTSPATPSPIARPSVTNRVTGPSTTGPATTGPATSDQRQAACATQRQAAKAEPTVATLRALGDCELARRFTTLDRLTAGIGQAKALTDTHRTALLAIIARTRTGLTALRSTIDADATVAALRADLPKIAQDYRVYLLVGPQVRLTRAADAGAAAVTRLNAVAERLQARIDRQRAAGKDVTAAQTALADLERNTALAAAQVGPVAGHVLPLLPADWNDGTAKPILVAARGSIKTARAELQAARKDAQACRADLR